METKKKYFYGKLRGRIVEKFGTITTFAEAVGISQTAMSHKLTGKTGFSQTDIELWSSLLEIDKPEWGFYFFE